MLLGKMLYRGQCLLKEYHRFPIGPAPHGLDSRLPAVLERFVPHLAPDSVDGQAVDVVGQTVAGERFQRLDNPRMQHAPPLREQTAVCHLAGQRVLKGVGVLREEVGLVDKLGCLEVPEAVVHGRLGQLGDSLQ